MLQFLACGRRGLAALLLGCLAGPLAADPGPLLHGCTAPLRPADDRNAAAMQRFLAEVDQYRQCISDFVDTNYAAADRHRDAAAAAALEWNGFVRDSLNAPQDFPWPPRATP